MIESRHDRASVGRRVAKVLSTVGFAAGLLILRFCSVGIPIAMPEPVSPPVVVTSGGSHWTTLRGDKFGQCRVNARVNGALVAGMLLDSGASGHLTFGSNHAAQLGFDPRRLSYDGIYNSANGYGREASVRIRELRLFDNAFVLRDVPAVITHAQQDEGLVGIEILRRVNFHLIGGNCEMSW
jgi:clan AA aspartic protease (TIGR02281 family)